VGQSKPRSKIEQISLKANNKGLWVWNIE